MKCVHTDQRRIRRAILVVRRRWPEAERIARSARIWERLAGLSCDQWARVILGGFCSPPMGTGARTPRRSS